MHFTPREGGVALSRDSHKSMYLYKLWNEPWFYIWKHREIPGTFKLENSHIIQICHWEWEYDTKNPSLFKVVWVWFVSGLTCICACCEGCVFINRRSKAATLEILMTVEMLVIRKRGHWKGCVQLGTKDSTFAPCIQEVQRSGLCFFFLGWNRTC